VIYLIVLTSLQVVTHHKVKQFNTEATSGHKNKYLLHGQKMKKIDPSKLKLSRKVIMRTPVRYR